MTIVNGQIESSYTWKDGTFYNGNGKMGWPLVMERWNGIGVILT